MYFCVFFKLNLRSRCVSHKPPGAQLRYSAASVYSLSIYAFQERYGPEQYGPMKGHKVSSVPPVNSLGFQFLLHLLEGCYSRRKNITPPGELNCSCDRRTIVTPDQKISQHHVSSVLLLVLTVYIWRDRRICVVSSETRTRVHCDQRKQELVRQKSLFSADNSED
jgi:hypothetical protein